MSSDQAANVFGNDNIVVLAEGSGVNVTVVRGQPHLRLTRYAKVTERAAKTGAEVALLSAFRRDVVPLIGRDAERASLRVWLDSDAVLSMRVIVGGAGRGKTRLAAEFCHEISGEWLAGFVGASEFERFRREGHTEQWRWDKPVLAVIDYPASRVAALKDWLKELVDASLENRPKLRLLLLERQAQREIGWLSELVGRGQDGESLAKIAMLDTPEPVALAPLEGLEFRREVFAAILAQKGLVAPQIGDDAIFDRHLSEHKWGGDPLFLMMAGLVAAQAGVAAALSLSRAELADKLALQELDRIGRIGAARGIDRHVAPRGRFLRRMAALATLVQGTSAEAARALAAEEASALGASVDLDTVVGALGEALPASEPGMAVGPILPDIVGEAALLAVFGEGGEAVVGGAPAEPRIPAAARTSLKAASATLVRAAQDFAGAGRLEPVGWLDALSETPEIDLGALMEIANALPNETLALRETAADLSFKIRSYIVEYQKFSPDSDLQPFFAWASGLLGNRLSDLGRREDALAAAEEALKIYRRLAAERPDAFLSDLAMSLNNLGNRLSDLGRREDALAAAEEALKIYQRLAAERPDAFLPDLAMSLNNLGAMLSDLGRREDALAAADEAVNIRRRLAAERPDAFLPYLAMSLNNLGNRLSDLGRREDALAAADEAVNIRRRLAAERPDAFLPDLAMSLNNLGNRLSNLGRREDALAAADEAVNIRRRLAAERPDAFLPDLAMSLNNLGNRLSDLGRRDDALAAADEALKIYRRLAAERPDAFLPNLAGSLNNLGARLSNLGRREDALAAAEEAVNIRRRLAAERPDAFLPDLAMSLNDLGAMLSDLGRHGDALAAADEALKIYRRLAAKRPDAFLSDLAMSLNNLGAMLSNLGRREDALAAAEEAVNIRRRLAAERPDAFLPDLAMSLNDLGAMLSDLGRHGDALAAADEAVSIFSPLYLRRPRAHAQWMAAIARNYIERCEALSREPDAEMLAPIIAAFESLQSPEPSSNPE